MKIVTRIEARAAGLKRYFTGEPCSKGHIDERQVSNTTCLTCGRTKNKSPATMTKDAARKKAWHEARRAEQLEKKRKYYLENMDRMKAINAAYRAERKDEQSARRRAHYEANKDRYIAQARARQLTLKRAMPSWADEEAIERIYAEAALLKKATGIDYHVDHFYPIAGETVCGLHVENNLRVITAAENMAKKNKVPETCES